MKLLNSIITRILYRNYRFSSGVKYLFKRRFTAAGLVILGTMLLTAGLGIDTNQAVAYQGFGLLICIVLFSILWTSFPPPRFTAQRILPRVGTAGNPLHYKVRVRNPGKRRQHSILVSEDFGDPRPTYTEFANTPEPGEQRRNLFDRFFRFYRWMWLIAQKEIATSIAAPLPALAPGETVETAMQIIPSRRGLLHLQGFLFTVPDPLGLCRAFSRHPSQGKVLILPKRYHVPRLTLGGALQYHPGGLSLASSLGESEEFMSTREYRRGDPLRHIHWKSTSKTGKLIVKEFQNEFFARHALVLDTFLESTANNGLFEEAVSVAASFALSLNTQESLLDLLFVGPQSYCITTGHGVAQVDHMLEILATVQPCTRNSFADLDDIVFRQIGLVSGCVCIFLEWDEDRRRLVEKMSAQAVPLLVLVLVPAGAAAPEPELSLSGPLRFQAIEQNRIAEELARL